MEFVNGIDSGIISSDNIQEHFEAILPRTKELTVCNTMQIFASVGQTNFNRIATES